MRRISMLCVWASLSVACATQTPVEQSRAGIDSRPQTQGIEQMQGRMDAMREQMARIHATEDPEERARLMQEHMQSMHDGMRMMGRMMAGSMGGAEGARECPATDMQCRMDDMQVRQQMMAQHMGMMQQMMGQMMEQITDAGATQAPVAPEALEVPEAPETPDAPETSGTESHAEHH